MDRNRIVATFYNVEKGNLLSRNGRISFVTYKSLYSISLQEEGYDFSRTLLPTEFDLQSYQFVEDYIAEGDLNIRNLITSIELEEEGI